MRRLDIEFQQAEHLPIAILFDHVYPLVLIDEVVHLAAEWKCANAEIIDIESIFVLQLVAAFAYGKVAAAVGDHTYFCANVRDFGAWKVGARRLELAIEPLHVVLIIVRTLTVECLLVVSRAAREVGRRGMLRARQGAIRDTIFVDIFIAREAAESVQIVRTEHLAALEWLFRIFERLGHPIIHA